MKKWICTNKCIVGGKLPGLNTDGGGLLVGLGEALLLPDDQPAPGKYFREAAITKKDEGFMGRCVFHLSSEQTS
jgi:hypothetical protein